MDKIFKGKQGNETVAKKVGILLARVIVCSLFFSLLEMIFCFVLASIISLAPVMFIRNTLINEIFYY